MKRLTLFVLLSVITIQVKLYAQQNLNSTSTIASTTSGNKSDLQTQNPAIKHDAISPATDKNEDGVQGVDGIGKKAAKHARKIKSFFSKISRDISQGYVKIASEKSATAVVKSN